MITLRAKAVALAGGVLAVMLSGCTSAIYKSNAKAPPAKPLDYPIPIYTPEMKVPRPGELIGTVTIHGGKFTMFGGDAEHEYVKLMREAHKRGADVVKVTTVDKPGFTNPNYNITAQLLSYADHWETIPVTKFKFQAYLDAHGRDLDPIEGIWFVDKPFPYSIAIMRNGAKPGREFVGFILHHYSPVWPPGTKRLDIRRGLEPGSYILTCYLDDFASREIPLILGQKTAFRINIPKEDEDNFITYTKF